MNFCWRYLYNSQNYCEGLNQWAIVPLDLKFIYITANLNKLKNFLESNQCIDDKRWNHKNYNPQHNLPQTCVRRKYIWPVWIQPTGDLLTHLRKSLRIMNADPINLIHTSQQPTKEVSNKKLEGYFISSKSINWYKWVWIPNLHPNHDLPQTCRGSRFVCPVWIHFKYSFLTHPRSAFIDPESCPRVC